jgi:hypothetical protein
MSWPLPCVSLKSDNGQMWISEYLGDESRTVNMDGNINLNQFAVFLDNEAYLTFGTKSTTLLYEYESNNNAQKNL